MAVTFTPEELEIQDNTSFWRQAFLIAYDEVSKTYAMRGSQEWESKARADKALKYYKELKRKEAAQSVKQTDSAPRRQTYIEDCVGWRGTWKG